MCVTGFIYPATCGPKGQGSTGIAFTDIPISCPRRGFRHGRVLLPPPFGLGVCDLVYLSRYMRPEGPWQRWWAFPSTFMPCARTGLTGHSGPPTPPTVRKKQRKDKGKRRTPSQPPKKKTKGKYILGWAWAPLLSATVLPPVLWGYSPDSHAPHSRGA